jgi:hypothetical protein
MLSDFYPAICRGSRGAAHDIQAHEIGKSMNSSAVDGERFARETKSAFGKGGWIEDLAWKF